MKTTTSAQQPSTSSKKTSTTNAARRAQKASKASCTFSLSPRPDPIEEVSEPDKSPGAETTMKTATCNETLSAEARDQKMVKLVRRFQRKPSVSREQRIARLMEPQLRRVAEIQLLVPNGCETFEEAQQRAEDCFFWVLLRYNLRKEPLDRMPMRLSFALLDALRASREREARERDGRDHER